tara:strand:- start:200 stop:361 length:162 start_codon:yes stop_codon:yes gene_type:complete
LRRVSNVGFSANRSFSTPVCYPCTNVGGGGLTHRTSPPPYPTLGTSNNRVTDR